RADHNLPANLAVRAIARAAGILKAKKQQKSTVKPTSIDYDAQEAQAALQELLANYGAAAEFLIEERLQGAEISILAFTDGKDYQLLQPSVDHKQLLAGDKGPNTGGMGAFCPVPFYDAEIKQAIIKEIVQPTLRGIQAEKFDYKGVLYFGIMLTETGPQLLEYNVRLGDPETEVVLPALKSDLAELILACFEGNLSQLNLEFHPGYFVDVVLASGGYPKAYTKGYEISGLENLEPASLCFWAGVQKQADKLLTAGGRVMNIVAQGNNLREAIAKVYGEVQKVKFQDSYYRPDIAQRDDMKKK
ncbi:MAG: phosphoribosylglycinamide synthetase C domain-containing protein, partial [Candidatus Cloacimonadales bacterium]